MNPPGDSTTGGGGANELWPRWEEVDRLFEAALDLSASERDGFLARRCGQDVDLLRTVKELLDLTAIAGERLAAPSTSLMRAAWAETEAVAEPASPLECGQRVGPYRIVAELGRGGMATVYDAERADGSFQHRVAVKVLRRGVDTDDVVRRFLAERQILSGLTHPNIARLLDGGTTEDGRPFLVMDRVAGEPITTFADRLRMPIRERLRLFLQVADAVHYAHQRLIVHRDLKPSNILVTAEGQAKLLDFGIAKLLGPGAEDALHTSIDVRPLTPDYASPEQLRGAAITTSSDVYQLGILLHVLLAGERPRDRAAPHAAPDGFTAEWTRPSALLRLPPTPAGDDAAALAHAEAVAARRGTTPERLMRVLRGDLDLITLKALRVEPDQRYDSAQAMAADVRRHLDDLPITARPASVRYRFGKFLERNRWFTPVAAMVLTVLLGFGITRIRHARQLERERNEARAQADRAEQLKGFLIDLFGSADPWAPADPQRGRQITVVEALALGAERARTDLADRPLLQADLLSSIARVYEGLDQRDVARSLLEEVLELRRRHDAARTPEFADELGRHARMLDGQWDSAGVEFQARLDLETALHGPDHPRVADALIGYSNLLSVLGDYQRCLEQRLEAIRILRAAGADQRRRLADVLGLIADTYRQLQRPEQAETAARESFELHRELFGDDHPSTATARVHVAQVADARGRQDEAIRLYREALPVLERTLGPDHFITIASWNNLGTVLFTAGDLAGAEDVHRRMLAVRRTLSRGEDNVDVAGSLQNLAATLMRQDRFSEAESLSLEAFRMYADLLPEGHYLPAFPLLTVAESQLLRGDGARSERTARRAVEMLRSGLPAGHFATAAAECRLGAAMAQQARYSDAEPLMASSLERLRSNEQAPDRYVRECANALDALRRATVRSGHR